MDNISDVIKCRAISNIKFLLQKYNIKVGDFEKSVDVQPGYISRLEKKENALPSFDFVYKASFVLNVDLNLLVNYDLTNLNQFEVLIIKFLYKIKSKLITNDLEFYFFNTNKPSASRYKNYEFDKIFDLTEENIGPYPNLDDKPSDSIYFSQIFGRNNTLVDNSYCVSLGENQYFFIIKCEEKVNGSLTKNILLETYVSTPSGTRELTNSLVSLNMKSVLTELYDYLSIKNTCPYLDKEMESFIKNFLEDKPQRNKSNENLTYSINNEDTLPF